MRNLPPQGSSQTVTFGASGGGAGSATWTGGGSPATATGSTIVTRFATPGLHTVSVSSGGATVTAQVRVLEASGTAWVSRFPGSAGIVDLRPHFAALATAFIAALQAAGARVQVSATFRPPERSYLMHWACQVARNGVAPDAVPARTGVDICWVHRNASGNVDVAASRVAASARRCAVGASYGVRKLVKDWPHWSVAGR